MPVAKGATRVADGAQEAPAEERKWAEGGQGEGAGAAEGARRASAGFACGQNAGHDLRFTVADGHGATKGWALPPDYGWGGGHPCSSSAKAASTARWGSVAFWAKAAASRARWARAAGR